MKTVLITGCSSGYGLQSARHFHAKGWKVIATMRVPRKDLFLDLEGIHVVTMDVTKPDSIARALDECGPIDVLVNNAGIGLFGAFEATPMSTVREIFETNTFGVMNACQAVIPQFRARRAGTIVNVTSSTTLAPFPLVAAYTASKTAVEGFTESLGHEMKSVGVKVKIVQPGYAPSTSFTANGQERMQGLITQAYVPFAQQVFAAMTQLDKVTNAQDVAEVVWRAANDKSDQLHFPAGADAVELAQKK
ncbi:MAG: SDR family oxidoreductase [Pseudomonadota bacterium]